MEAFWQRLRESFTNWLFSHDLQWLFGAVVMTIATLFFTWSSQLAQSHRRSLRRLDQAWNVRASIAEPVGNAVYRKAFDICQIEKEIVGSCRIRFIGVSLLALASAFLIGWSCVLLVGAIALGFWCGHNLDMAFKFIWAPWEALNDPADFIESKKS